LNHLRGCLEIIVRMSQDLFRQMSSAVDNPGVLPLVLNHRLVVHTQVHHISAVKGHCVQCRFENLKAMSSLSE